MSVIGESTPSRRPGRRKGEMVSNVQGTQEARQEDRDWGQQEMTQRGKELSPLCWPRSLSCSLAKRVRSSSADGETGGLAGG